MIQYLPLIALLVWLALAIYGEEAPLGLWKICFLPAAAVILFAAVAIIFVGSFGNQRLDLHVDDK